MLGDTRNSSIAFVAVTTLFFAWGFITSMNDPLIPAVRAVFELNYAESLLTQFAFFIAYGVVSIPSGWLVAKLGYTPSIVLAFTAMIVGCLGMPLATSMQSYAIVLIALFIIASGITVLQVAANPLSAALGSASSAHFRLTLSQAFNSLGTVLGPWLGATVMLQGGLFGSGAEGRNETLRNIDFAYFLMAGMLTALAIFIWRMRPRINAVTPKELTQASAFAALKSKWALLGAVCIFFYVGAEVSVASVMINLLHLPTMLDVSLATAGTLLGFFYWGGAMAGRFAGSMLLRRYAAPRLLAVAAFMAALLCFAVSQGGGLAGSIAALAIGLFNSVMFPVIFTVTLERSSAPMGATSGLLCMAIIGGAVIPPLTGRLADATNLHAAFLLPLACYAIIGVIAWRASLVRPHFAESVVSVSG